MTSTPSGQSSPVHSFNKYLLSAGRVPSTVLGTGAPENLVCRVYCCSLSQGIRFVMGDAVDFFLSVK